MGGLSPRLVRRVVSGVFVAGVAGMIVMSIRGSTGGALTFGLVTAVGAICLMLTTALVGADAFGDRTVDEGLALDVEQRVRTLADSGADEDQLRQLVGRAVELGRTQPPS